MLWKQFAFLPVAILTWSLPMSAQSFSARSMSASTSTTRPHSSAADLPPMEVMNAHIKNGTLTVDGMVAKVHMNYDINGSDFLYFYLPGGGTAIVALSRFPNAVLQKKAVNGSTITINGNGHIFQLTTDGKVFDDKHQDLWTRFDVGASALGRYPMVGFGNSLTAPFAWPASQPPTRAQLSGDLAIVPPPVPVNLLPRYATVSTPAKPSGNR